MVDRNTIPKVTVSYSEGDGTPRANAIPPKSLPPLPAPSPVQIFQQNDADSGLSIIGPGYVPPPAKLPDRSLAALRPRDSSSEALRRALVQIKIEREAAVQRVDVAQGNGRQALTDDRATAADVAAFESRAREAEIEIERLDALTVELKAKCESALRQEAAARARAKAAQTAHAEAAAALAKALPGYPHAAEQVIDICRLARACDDALAALKQAATEAGVRSAPAADATDTGFLTHVVLPAPAGGTLWGTLPKPQLAHPYLNAPRGPYA